jgi:molecular chaperone DnaK
VVQDITSRSLRVGHYGGKKCEKNEDGTNIVESTVLIPRFSRLPARATYNLTTAVDQQVGAGITVLEGEHLYAKDNLLLAEFLLTGIQRAKRGIPIVEVMFELDENGILKVTATDLSTKATKSLVITDVFGFGKLPQNFVEGIRRAVPLLRPGMIM